MPDETFEIGDRVFLTSMKHFGTIVKMEIQPPHNVPVNIGVSIRCYSIKLDDGCTINGIYRGLRRISAKTSDTAEIGNS